MQRQLLPVARRFWRNVDNLSPLARVTGVGDVFGTLYALPLALIGLGWLLRRTDWQLFRAEGFMLALIFLLLYLFSRLNFFVISEIRLGVFADFDGSLDPIIIFGAVLTFGPSVMWLSLIWLLVLAFRNWRRSRAISTRWNIARNMSLEICRSTLGILLACNLYEQAGGVYPLPALDVENLFRAFYMMSIWLLISTVLYLPLITYWNSAIKGQDGSAGGFMVFFTFMLGWTVLVMPFGVLLAGLYTIYGLDGYLYFVIGLVLTALLAHQLSRAVESSRRRSIELEKLELLGRAILNAPADASTLKDLLRQHVGSMFPQGQIEIRLYPDQTLVRHPEQAPPAPAAMWRWLHDHPAAQYFVEQATLPWTDDPCEFTLILVPIMSGDEASKVLGAIQITLRNTLNRRDLSFGADVLPAAQSLAAQIASAMQRAHAYDRVVSHQRVSQELALAGKVQSSFLPTELPEIEGWQLAASLEPARQTSGDFYDVIPLPDGRLGIVVADVADKGMGAALFMALCRTLIRTYATEYTTWPEIALQAANHRIMMDTSSDLFVTVFYGVLDPDGGTFTYCNAGHNPVILVRHRKSGDKMIQTLTRTGVPLGLFKDFTWEAVTVEIELGDALILYTDGVTEAQNPAGEFFGELRLLDLARTHKGRSARAIHSALIRSVYRFLDGVPLHDDLTVVVAVRDA